MSGRPAQITRYSVTLAAAHFPVGDEVYEFGVTLDAGETLLGVGTIPSSAWDATTPPAITDEDGVVTITGAGDSAGAAEAGSIECFAVVGEPGFHIVVAPPAEPE